jgi:hypothetical protein
MAIRMQQNCGCAQENNDTATAQVGHGQANTKWRILLQEKLLIQWQLPGRCCSHVHYARNSYLLGPDSHGPPSGDGT